MYVLVRRDNKISRNKVPGRTMTYGSPTGNKIKILYKETYVARPVVPRSSIKQIHQQPSHYRRPRTHDLRLHDPLMTTYGTHNAISPSLHPNSSMQAKFRHSMQAHTREYVLGRKTYLRIHGTYANIPMFSFWQLIQPS